MTISSKYMPAVSLLMVLLLFWAVSTTHAQTGNKISVEELTGEADTLTLTQSINIALANNTQIKRSLLTLKDADQRVRIAWSEVMPEISGSASYARNLELPVFFFPADPTDPNSPLRAIQAGEDNNWNASFSVSQTLFRGEAIVGISNSQLFKAAQAENLRATSQEIVTQTRIAYYNVLVAEEQLRLQRETVSRLKKNLSENRSRQKAGLIDEYAVLQVEVQLSNQEPQLTQAKYDLQKAYRELKLLMGVPLEIRFSVIGDLSNYEIISDKTSDKENRDIKEVDNLTPYSFQEDSSMMQLAKNMRGDLRVLDKRQQLKEKEILAIKSRFLPTFSTSYNLGWRAEEPGSPTFFGNDRQRVRTQSIMLTMRLPIFQGFERSANLEIAQIERKDLKVQEENALRNAKNEIESAKESLNQAIETAPAREKALKQAREGYDRAKARLENGIGSQLDVTEAEFQLRQAEVNYARMVYNYLSAKARYDQAIGAVPFVDKSKPELN